MKRNSYRWLAIVVLLTGIVAGFALYLIWKQQPVPIGAATPVQTAEPEIRYPVPLDAAAVLPPLDQSDGPVASALAELFGAKALKNLLKPEQIVRHIVATVDNLPREKVAGRVMPTRPVAGKFQTASDGKEMVIARENAARYAPFVRLVESVDPEKLVALYTHYYPLFQQSYQDLGYPKGYFNDRLVAVIDHMLAAPVPEGPVALVQPHIFYQFASADLEASSAGHKILFRMGPENAARIKARLQQIRPHLTGRTDLAPSR